MTSITKGEAIVNRSVFTVAIPTQGLMQRKLVATQGPNVEIVHLPVFPWKGIDYTFCKLLPQGPASNLYTSKF